MQQLSPLSHHRISTQRVPKNNIPMGANYFALIDAWAYVTVVPRTKGNKTSRALDEYSWWWHRLYDSFNFSRERDRTIYCSIAVCGPCRNLLEDQLSFFNGIHALDICPLFVHVWQLSCQISSSPILWSILMHRFVRVLIQKKKGGKVAGAPCCGTTAKLPIQCNRGIRKIFNIVCSGCEVLYMSSKGTKTVTFC